jgi:hypothetical protein
MLWLVVAVALGSGAQYFSIFLRKVVSFAGPMPPASP